MWPWINFWSPTLEEEGQMRTPLTRQSQKPAKERAMTAKSKSDFVKILFN